MHPVSRIQNHKRHSKYLSHRITPGRTYRPMVSRQSWNFDQWHEGDWSKAVPGGPQEEAQIETKSLIEVRDWTDQRLDLLGKELERLADSKGYRNTDRDKRRLRSLRSRRRDGSSALVNDTFVGCIPMNFPTVTLTDQDPRIVAVDVFIPAIGVMKGTTPFPVTRSIVADRNYPIALIDIIVGLVSLEDRWKPKDHSSPSK